MTNTFQNVTIYTKGGFGNIVRTDVKEVTVETGVKYAQYNNALKVRWKEPRQRTPRGMMLDYKPFLFIVNRKDAFEPDDMLLPTTTDTNGTTGQHSRYSMCDDRWESDFAAQLQARGITPLFDAGMETKDG